MRGERLMVLEDVPHAHTEDPGPGAGRRGLPVPLHRLGPVRLTREPPFGVLAPLPAMPPCRHHRGVTVVARGWATIFPGNLRAAPPGIERVVSPRDLCVLHQICPRLRRASSIRWAAPRSFSR